MAGAVLLVGVLLVAVLLYRCYGKPSLTQDQRNVLLLIDGLENDGEYIARDWYIAAIKESDPQLIEDWVTE